MKRGREQREASCYTMSHLRGTNRVVIPERGPSLFPATTERGLPPVTLAPDWAYTETHTTDPDVTIAGAVIIRPEPETAQEIIVEPIQYAVPVCNSCPDKIIFDDKGEKHMEYQLSPPVPKENAVYILQSHIKRLHGTTIKDDSFGIMGRIDLVAKPKITLTRSK
jgi:hypothetical protein